MTANERILTTQVREWAEAHREELVADIMRLVSVRSVSDRTDPVKPYGQGCRDVVDLAMKICGGHGFPATNNEYYSCTTLLPGKTEQQIGIFCHLDVVPEGTGWTADPYTPYVKDGFIIGRGSKDNKGSAMASLYTMRCLRDLGVKLDHTLLLYLGCAEETGMDDVEHYLSKHDAPVFSYTADAGYSVCYGEKGLVRAQFRRNLAGSNLVDFRGGQVTNAVAGHAEALVSGVKLEDVQRAIAANERLSAAQDGANVRITAVGKAAHAAFPEGGINAIWILADALAEHGIVTGAALDAMRFIADALKENYGQGLNIAFEDDISGKTTCVGGLSWMENGVYVQDINVRYAIKTDIGALERQLRETCGKHGFEVTLLENSAPTYTEKDHPAIAAMDDSVRAFYGERFSPYVMGGGTYARKIPNAVGFGPGTREKTPFGAGHQPDEAVHIDTLITAIQIYSLALTRIDRIL